MERVLYNLIANAVNYTDELAEIIVRIQRGEEHNTVSIEVQDTGVGIRESDLDHIFEKFYRIEGASRGAVSSTGSGIGLYLCRHIVELHGGNIHAEIKV